MAIRNTKSGEEVKTAISDETPNARVDIIQLDLASLASVRSFAEEFKSRKLPLNVLMWVFSPMLSHFGYINLLWIDISSLVVSALKVQIWGLHEGALKNLRFVVNKMSCT